MLLKRPSGQKRWQTYEGTQAPANPDGKTESEDKLHKAASSAVNETDSD